jgi:hypothetical protein
MPRGLYLLSSKVAAAHFLQAFLEIAAQEGEGKRVTIAQITVLREFLLLDRICCEVFLSFHLKGR